MSEIHPAAAAGSPVHGTNYWRSLQELADTDEYRHQLEHEFPSGIDAPADGITRRRFLQVMSASIAMASLAGCRWPVEKIVPFAQRPEGVMPGKPMQFATTMELGPVAHPVLATSYDGRPIKIDGNPGSGLSGGATSAFAQASVLDLYDPDRAQKIIRRGGGRAAPGTWDEFVAFARQAKAAPGRIAFLTGASTSPATNTLLTRLGQAGAGIYLWEPVCRVNEMQGAKKAFGTGALVQLDLDQARVIVDFDANLMQDHPTAVRNSKQFAAARRPENGEMNRLYCWETTYSITGGMADHRFPTTPGNLAAAVWALAAELVLGEGLPLPNGAGLDRRELAKWRGHEAGGEHLAAVAKDLMAHRGESLLVAGLRQEPDVHALVHVLNEALGNAGKAVSYLPIQTPQIRFLPELVRELNKGNIDTLVILGGNPVYTAPVDLDFAAAMGKAKNRVHLAARDDATSAAATWHIPQAHYLESWGDAMGWDLTHLSVQPLIAPLYEGRCANEVLSAFADEQPRTGYEIARDSFHAMSGGRGPAPVDDKGFEKRWREFIHDGFRRDAAAARGRSLALAGAPLTAPVAAAKTAAGNLEIHFVHDQSTFDGRFADNAWLQEMPDFMTKLTWDNAALFSPATAAELGVKHGDVVTLGYDGRELEMAAYVLPGQAKYAVTVSLGYGREDAGRVGRGAGFDTYRLRTWDHLHHGGGLKVTPTGRTYKLATTQDHHAIDTVGAAEIQKRVPGLVREGTLADYKADEHFVDHLGVHSPPLESLWKEWDYTGYKWGMAIDLNLCNGCNACVIGCQAENNVAVVGKDEVARGREMSWIRMDRYFLGDPEAPKVAQQPVGCAQCETAPCEQVCPVAATMHTEEGLNAMVYNRCVGTRYCSNNCPYKVRRFNWFNNFEDLTETQRLVLNPDVTVRARGVMEKCTYCVQRIEGARVDAKVAGRGIRDGDVTPACAQTCPSDAIVFGDLNDKDSRVSRLREASRSYDLLNYLNLKPRTFYMARIRNPNPAIEPARTHGDGHGGGHGGGHEGGHEAGGHG